MWLSRLVLFPLLASSLAGQPVLHLKSGHSRETGSRSPENGPQRPLQSRRLGQTHWIVQFPTAPEPAQLDQLRSRGARILGYVPDFGFSVSGPDNTDFAGLGLHWADRLTSEDKVSPLLAMGQDEASVRFVVVEFQPDVAMNDARAIVIELQFQILDNPDLLDHHLLVSGTSQQIAGLGQWDEVAYVFPASDELIAGIAVQACAGALTQEGPVGQSILKVGDGWGGPGRNGADLSYAFFNKTPKLPPDSVTSEIVRAFSEWAKFAKLTFTATGTPQASRTLAILFGSREHGDAYPFDGPGGVLAHTFYPFPVNPEPIAGDLHFDADENWNIGANVDLFSVALHETGHALGLGHSDKPGTVMYPYYRKGAGLTDEDIAAVLSMYAAQDGAPGGAATTPLALAVDEPGVSTQASVTLQGTSSGGSGDIRITWATNRGFSGAGTGGNTWTAGPIPLSIGFNSITITAKDSRQAQAIRTVTVVRQPGPITPPAAGLQLDILMPSSSGAFNTSTANISLSGTASEASGILRVTWSNSRGGSGQASGTANWNTGSIALQSGASTITVTAEAQNGTTAARTLQVSYAPASSSTPPALTIVSPALTTVSTQATSIAISGTALDNSGLGAVTWTSSTGASGTAIGTSSWNITAIPLLVGTNTITVRVTNLAGAAAWRSIVVTRL